MYIQNIIKIAHLFAKEWRLLFRNPHGLVVLFFMPSLFILIMSFTLKDSLVETIEMPVTGWVIEDDSLIAERMYTEWAKQYNAKQLSSREALMEAMKEKELSVGVLILKDWLDEEGMPQAKEIDIWVDGSTHPASASRLRSELMLAVLDIQIKIATAKAGPFANMLAGQITFNRAEVQSSMPLISYLDEVISGRKITAIQKSVPVWFVFGMFFVVIPIAGVLIQERNEGTWGRLYSFGVSPSMMLAGKAMAFVVMNWIQFGFMLLVGRWLVPWLGGDVLHFDIDLGWLLLFVTITSVAAVSLALLIAAFSSSFEQAAALGGGVNVILGAIAGVMVPRAIMPESLQRISEWSPMGWALDGMQAIFLGIPESSMMWTRVGLLFLFAMCCYILAWWRSTRFLDT